MARPKTLRKPSQKRVERAARRKLRRSHTLISGGIGDYTSNGYVNFTSGRNGAGSGARGSVMISATTVSAANGTGSVYTNVSAANGTGSVYTNRYVVPERQVVIESLDEGVTWHTSDTMEPAKNLDGKLLVGTRDYGPAPETMRPGSGVYSYTFTMRAPTDAEAAEWMTQYAAREADWQTRAAERQADAVRRQAELERERAESMRRAEEETEKSARAKARAEDLLLSHLTASQREDLRTKDGFWVTSQFGNRYWVTRSTAVRFDENGVALQRYCIHATDHRIPPEDNALMRKLVLECDEELFLRTANPGRPHRLDLERRQPVQLSMPDYVTTTNPANYTFSGTGANMVIAPGATAAADYVALTNDAFDMTPILFWINGVVRPVTA